MRTFRSDNFNELKARFEEIKEEFDKGNDDHEQIYDLEERLNHFEYSGEAQRRWQELEALKRNIKNFKEEESFYNAEAELDHMFPDRHDEDFDEDSMSWDSVFGDE
ncbi:hypothetical protein [Leeuwenhoekiella aequorea]|uniref:Uncharacterized protein n=1 Tax=Leeuwenhoekiella aequorea TaxID=283736 RepID=A0A4Q0P721_9FLAO|nr:hypothetical protein [Leeuwenhoekiella aequorea]RXG21926.1 hypothetical protein DSM00_1990 [Leeuwenhoekiella aequorea]